MAVYIVSYDLSSPGQDYKPLHDALKKVEHCKPLESFWLIDVNQTVVDVRDALLTFMDKNDQLVVIEFHQDADWATRVGPAALRWIKARRP